jgi:hypothetical protein
MLEILITIFISLSLNPTSKKAIATENICSIMLPRGGDEDWGRGAFIIPDSFELEINDKHKLSGKIDSKSPFIKVTRNSNVEITLKDQDIEYLGHYQNRIIKVKHIDKNKNAVIFWKTFDGGIKVPIIDFEKNGAKFFTYRDLLFSNQQELITLRESEWVNIGVNINKSCLNLRDSNSIDSRIIKCIPGNDWETERHYHMKIIKAKGNWAKVQATRYQYNAEKDESGEGCTFDEIENLEGWVKAIDKSGFPNIWYSVTSY